MRLGFGLPQHGSGIGPDPPTEAAQRAAALGFEAVRRCPAGS